MAHDFDLDNAEVHKGKTHGRTIVSVSMSGEEFDLLFEAAKKQKKYTSTYIREAALSAARGFPTVATRAT